MVAKMVCLKFGPFKRDKEIFDCLRPPVWLESTPIIKTVEKLDNSKSKVLLTASTALPADIRLLR